MHVAFKSLSLDLSPLQRPGPIVQLPNKHFLLAVTPANMSNSTHSMSNITIFSPFFLLLLFLFLLMVSPFQMHNSFFSLALNTALISHFPKERSGNITGNLVVTLHASLGLHKLFWALRANTSLMVPKYLWHHLVGLENSFWAPICRTKTLLAMQP